MVRYLKPSITTADGGGFQIKDLDFVREPVALVGTCCDLVIHPKVKRIGYLTSPLRNVPSDVAKYPERLEVLRMPLAEVVEKDLKTPAALFYYDAIEDEALGAERHAKVIRFEALTVIGSQQLQQAEKLSELTDAARREFKARIAHFFTRVS